VIGLEVELLTGRYVATCFNDRSEPEWPPHPARLFSALVATAYEHEELTEAARSALTWLEEQGPPEIEASDAETRAVLATFVPENGARVIQGWGAAEAKLQAAREALVQAETATNARALKAAQKAVAATEKKLAEQMGRAIEDDGKGNPAEAQELLPDRRGRQPRTMPSCVPHRPLVRYLWVEAEPNEEVKTSLTELSRKLVRLGHSSSLVTCRVLEQPTTPEPSLKRWRPTDGPGIAMRVVNGGQLDRLEGAFAKHRGVAPRVLPATHQAYALEGGTAQAVPSTSVFGEWIVLREIAGQHGRRIGLKLSKTEDLSRALRGALLSHADAPIPAALSGHDDYGRPVERPHVAYLPLADIASKHASGNVLGVAILLPREMTPEERRQVLRAIGRFEQAGLRLTLGRLGALHLERITDEDPRRTLAPAWWTRPACRWGSVTPVALDRNPGDLSSSDPEESRRAARAAEELVMQACQHIGLPTPRWVEIIRRSLFDAAPAARHYMPFPRKSAKGNGFSRVCVHIELCFEEPVAGPVVIGAGRYFGIGLCCGRPM